jgi:anti-sigma factor RsiW
MACENWLPQLDRYVDGELPVADAAALSAHLRACPDCAGEILQRVQLKRSVKTAGKRYVPSSELRSNILKKFGTKASRRAKWWRFALIPALATLVAACLLTVYVQQEKSMRNRVYSELIDLHVATLASSNPVDVVSSDRHTVKPWFQGKIPFSFNLPELQGSDFTLLGGRVFYLEETPGAHLIYRIRKHDISVFILPEQFNHATFSTGAAVDHFFQTDSWTQNGLRYFVIGDANMGDLKAISKLLRDAG